MIGRRRRRATTDLLRVEFSVPRDELVDPGRVDEIAESAASIAAEAARLAVRAEASRLTREIL